MCFFLNHDANVQSDYPTEKSCEIRFVNRMRKTLETPIKSGEEKNKKNPIEFSEKLNRMVIIGKCPLFRNNVCYNPL